MKGDDRVKRHERVKRAEEILRQLELLAISSSETTIDRSSELEEELLDLFHDEED